jgi:hypothetical protein
MIFYVAPVTAQADYDVIHNDPEGDVYEYSEDALVAVIGHENIDILTVRSYKANLKQEIILELTVSGLIIVSSEYNYMFSIMDRDEEVYIIMYMNGSCMGISSQNFDSEPDELEATGDLTDTLKVILPLKNLGIVTEFDCYGMASEYTSSEDEFIMYMDSAPDQNMPWGNGDGYEERILIISEPTNGSTVFGDCEINGVTNFDEHHIQFVEVQIDSTSSSGWESVVSDDDWSTWEYNWDTEETFDGWHRINARAYDGEDYHFDTIYVYVDQKTATSPRETKLPEHQPGDEYLYKMRINTDSSEMPEGMSLSGNMKISFVAIDLVNINGSDYDVYIIEMKSISEASGAGFSSINSMDGTIWVRRSDFATVKEVMEYEDTSTGFGGNDRYYSKDIITSDPPADMYQFPICVCEKWEMVINRTVESTYFYEGDEPYTEKYTDEATMKNECLRTETITTPAGSFDTFVLYNYDISEYDRDEDWEDWEYNESQNDSDNDGFTNAEEEHYGTDPYDPSDFPEDGTGEVVYVEDSYGSSNSEMGYSLSYYSPDIGLFVRMDNYDSNRQLIMYYELVSYKYGDKSYTPPISDVSDTDSEFEIPFYFLILLILIILIIIPAVILAVRKRRKRLQRLITSRYPSQDVITTPIPSQEVRFEEVDEPEPLEVRAIEPQQTIQKYDYK